MPKIEYLMDSCHCKEPKDKTRCNGRHCVNQYANVDCPEDCGKGCKNQRFRKREYAKVAWFHTGDTRGAGLMAEENIKKDDFIIEYVGEIISLEEYEKRQERFENNPELHSHFMDMVDTEYYIDADVACEVAHFLCIYVF